MGNEDNEARKFMNRRNPVRSTLRIKGRSDKGGVEHSRLSAQFGGIWRSYNFEFGSASDWDSKIPKNEMYILLATFYRLDE
jgi:hypothetical protein